MTNHCTVLIYPRTKPTQGIAKFHGNQVEMMLLSELVYHCLQERSYYRKGKDVELGYGYELFRRALVGEDERAWAWVCKIYRSLIAQWVERNPSFPRTDEGVSHFVDLAFAKMRHSIPVRRFTHFPNLKSLLRYLKMCVNSTLVDHLRTQRHRATMLAYEESIKPLCSGRIPTYSEIKHINQNVLAHLHRRRES